MAPPPTQADRYEALHAGFRWRVPARFNMGQACAGRWAQRRPEAEAIRQRPADGPRRVWRYGELNLQALKLARVMHRLGVGRGDRVALVLPQRPETALGHLACHALGAVAMPLSHLFGPEALAYRLEHSEARLVLTDPAGAAALEALPAAVRAGLRLLCFGAPGADAAERLLGRAQPWAGYADTAADDPALLIYTSGTTGPPKGALIPHRALIGNLSGFVCSQNWYPQRDAVFWSPADWAWTGGLMDALLPTLYFGGVIVGHDGRFDPEGALALMQAEGVTHSFLFPTALKAIMKAVPRPRESHALKLRAVMSAGEAVGETLNAWGRSQLGLQINEMFGQTEVNYIVGGCSRSLNAEGREAAGWPARAGSMGRGYPGHRVAVINEEGQPCRPGELGEVAVHRRDRHGHPDPVFFLGYWGNEAATRAKFTGDPADSWCRTGDTALMDEAGYLFYQGRSDDMFKAAGYRIGPSEVENCLLQHAAVANVAVVPKPDAERGAVVKAYVVLAPGHQGDQGLVAELQQHVRGRLAPYEYPKDIEFIAALPMTTTGKVQRRVLREQELERARDAQAVAGLTGTR